MSSLRRGGIRLTVVALALLVVAAPVSPRAAGDHLAGGHRPAPLGGAGMGAAGFNAVASALPVEFVAPLHSGYVEDYFTVLKASWGKDVKRVGDLKGKPVALNVRGAAVEWMLDQVLRRDGLTLGDVQVRIMPFPDMVPALESGAVEAAILTEPFPTLAEERGIAVRPLPRPADARGTPITAIFWNKDWAAKTPDLAHKVMLAYLKAACSTRISPWTPPCSTPCNG